MTDDARLDWEARIDRRREGGTAPTPILDPTLRRLGYPAARLLWTEWGARYHALRLLSRLGDVELPVTLEGDGAGGLVQAWAGRRAAGSVAVLVWASTLDQSKRDGDVSLARRVRLEGLPGPATVTRLDREHGDITTLASRLGVQDWPTESQWAALRTADGLHPEPISSDIVDLPQPGAILVEYPMQPHG